MRRKIVGAILVIVALMSTAASCKAKVGQLASLMSGRAATITTYNVLGKPIDRVHGVSIDIRRDATFDSVNPDGTTNADSSVITISIGGGVMTHVGSTLLMVQDGVVDVTGQLPATVDIINTDRGVPLLNYLRQEFRNLWQGTSRTILVRSQQGYPIAIFGGNEVEYFATDIPKSTLLRIDKRYVLIYRSDYSIYDNTLFK